MGHTYSKMELIVYLKSKLNGHAIFFLANPTSRPLSSLILGLLKKVSTILNFFIQENCFYLVKYLLFPLCILFLL